MDRRSRDEGVQHKDPHDRIHLVEGVGKGRRSEDECEVAESDSCCDESSSRHEGEGSGDGNHRDEGCSLEGVVDRSNHLQVGSLDFWTGEVNANGNDRCEGPLPESVG